MLRSHRVRVSSSASERLWGIGVRVGKDPNGPAKHLHQQSYALAGHSKACNWTKLLQCRSLSSGLIKSSAGSPGLPVDEDGNVLVSAAKEAQRLSDLAAKSRPERDSKNNNPPKKTWREPSSLVSEKFHKRDVDEETIQSALESAQALLFVTRLSSPLQHAIQNRQDAPEDIQEQVTLLHRAFLAVTSWLLDVVTMSNKPEPRILDMALQVARRAHQLQLPFHVPLYIRLVNAVAESYQPPPSAGGGSTYRTTTSAGALILELAGRATTMLGPTALQSSQFFREPLEALVRRRCFGDVAFVLKGMERQNLELDKGTLLQLLFTLELTVQEDDDDTHQNWEDTADVLEILNLADPYLWKTITALTSLSGVWNRKQEKKRQLERSMRQARGETLLPTLPSYATTAEAGSRPLRRKRVTSETSYNDGVREWVYQCDSISEPDAPLLPDITLQIEALYNGQDFRYSKEVEQEIFQRNMDDAQGDMEDEDYADYDAAYDSDDTAYDTDELFDDMFDISDVSDDEDSDDDLD